MARKKKPENESPVEMLVRQTLENISNAAGRSEKTSWNRKMDNMVKLISKLRPIEEKIIELQGEKMPILDDIAILRATMVVECVHPFEQLVFKEDHSECKFCMKKISIPTNG